MRHVRRPSQGLGAEGYPCHPLPPFLYEASHRLPKENSCAAAPESQSPAKGPLAPPALAIPPTTTPSLKLKVPSSHSGASIRPRPEKQHAVVFSLDFSLEWSSVVSNVRSNLEADFVNLEPCRPRRPRRPHRPKSSADVQLYAVGRDIIDVFLCSLAGLPGTVWPAF